MIESQPLVDRFTTHTFGILDFLDQAQALKHIDDVIEASNFSFLDLLVGLVEDHMSGLLEGQKGLVLGE